jgi:hypothetical protein
MAHQKVNYVLIMLFVVSLFSSCKKESKEYTTVIWEVINPVTNAPYTNILVRLYEAKKTNSGIEYSLIYEGKTNNQGRAEYSFKAYLSGKYWYEPEINEGALGVNGIDYTIIKQPSPSVYNVKKDEENIIRYEIIPYHNRLTHVKNFNCQGSGDIMRYRQKYLYTGSGGWTIWTPDHVLYEGCIDDYSDVRSRPLDHIVTEIEVTRQNGSVENYIDTSFIKGENNVDTIKVYY